MHVYRHPPETVTRALLTACGLPTADLHSGHFEHFFGCGSPENPQGVVGLELFDSCALLRSLAVAAKHRGLGCGKALVAAAERYARDKGVRALYLLTTTAEEFFFRLGYRRAERQSAPEPIRKTKEFSDLCPETSAFMVKQLDG
jgi:amino-acid N-acetyltransferase